jgi:hypothetical protein
MVGYAQTPFGLEPENNHTCVQRAEAIFLIAFSLA